MFCTLRVLLGTSGCKLQPADWIHYSNQRWRTDWNMETDRAGLCEEYEWLKAAGATDACYGCLLCRYEPSTLGISSWLVGHVGLKWVSKKNIFALFWYQTDWYQLLFQLYFINSTWMDTNRGHNARHFASLQEKDNIIFRQQHTIKKYTSFMADFPSWALPLISKYSSITIYNKPTLLSGEEVNKMSVFTLYSVWRQDLSIIYYSYYSRIWQQNGKRKNKEDRGCNKKRKNTY